jgi:molybdenum cofactor synthesis domain-containing protein
VRTIPVVEAVGAVLCHDVTRIVPGGQKGPAFRKGHIIRPEDIPLLLSIGKERIYVLDLPSGTLHEDDAAERISRAAAGPGVRFTGVCEGKVNLVAVSAGLLKVNAEGLLRINAIEGVVFGTLHSNQQAQAGSPVAGTRVIPLVIEERKIKQVEAICQGYHPIIQVKPFRSWKIGMVTTGSEVYHGRIVDKFGPVIRQKFAELGSSVFEQVLVSDDQAMTVAAIHRLIAAGADMVVATGGMSVDPDDQTPGSIRTAGGEVVVYGAPVFPGAMFMLAYIGRVPVLGLPGCVMYFRTTIFDLIVPRLLVGETVGRQDIEALGHGGFCAACPECRYPLCGFGKG